LKKKRVAGKIKEKEYKELRVEVKTVVGRTKEKEMETKNKKYRRFPSQTMIESVRCDISPNQPAVRAE
jgi:hypothetical protein